MPRKRSEEFTTIGIRKETRDRLKHFGFKGRLYDEILNDLMDAYEQTLEKGQRLKEKRRHEG